MNTPKCIRHVQSRNRFKWLFWKMGFSGSGCEVGVLHGNFSEHCFKHSQLSHWVGVDPFLEYRGYEWKSQREMDHIRNVAESRYARLNSLFGKTAELITDVSENAVELFDDGEFDFVYIDANHSYEFVKNDIELWWPKVRNGGILAGHDYEPIGHFGVIKAVNEFVAKEALPLHVTSDNFPSWLVHKPGDYPHNK